MRRLFRPTTLILVSAALALGVAAVALWPGRDKLPSTRAVPQPVPPGDQEIVWLYAANQGESWERLVSGIRQLAGDRPDIGLEIADDANVFPAQSTAVPQLAVTLGRSKQRLWFRWYKLTSDQNTHDWVEVLTRRQPPPLAIIGGGSSDRAYDVARELEAVRTQLASPPLFAITSATADQVTVERDEWLPVVIGDQVYQERKREKQDLMRVYPERTFRFCFTNTQMARSVTNFIWGQPELRPDADPAYVPVWEDDPYSQDLADRFVDVLRQRSVKAGARAWAWQAAGPVAGGLPLDLAGVYRGEYPLVSRFSQWNIPHSIGTFSQPNEWEAQAAQKLIDELESQRPTQRRALLALPAPAAQPARRFLRGLLRSEPASTDRFVVGLGDSFDFNTVYRDRNVTWPIQDLPFNLVFFCHRNPVDPVAFEPDEPGKEAAVPDPSRPTCTGTDYLLLYRDAAEGLIRAAYQSGTLVADAGRLAQRLRTARLQGGRLRFDGVGREVFDVLGNRHPNSGECVVWLEPLRGEDNRVLPQARLHVFRADPAGGQRWQREPIAGRPELLVSYGSGSGPFPAAGREGEP